MKTIAETIQYRHLKAKMKAKCDANGVKWASYYADLLDLGGVKSDQYLRNYFNDDEKRFKQEQLATIYNDLDEHKNLNPYTQAEIQQEILRIVGTVGKISEKMGKHFDDKEDLTLDEILPLVPDSRKMYQLVSELSYRLEETKAQL